MCINPIRFPLHSVQKQTKLSIVLEGIIRKIKHSKMVESYKDLEEQWIIALEELRNRADGC